MALEFIKLVKGDSPVAQVGSYGFFKLGVESGGGGSDIVFDRVFGNNTPDVISAVSAEISANNMTSAQVAETYGWNLGDTKDITLTTGEVIQMRIIGFNHDDLTGGGKAGITLQMTHCLATKTGMQSDRYNAAVWKDCKMRTVTLPEIKASLPNEWASIIKTVDKKQQYSSANIETVSDDLFLLAECEILNTTVNAISENEGLQYDYWKQANTYIMNIDTNGDGVLDSAVAWWLRSNSSHGSTTFCMVLKSGGFTYTEYTANRYGVSFAFCV